MDFSTEYAAKHWQDILKIQKYTVRLLLQHKKDYKVYGTGVFINIDGNYLLLTAAHVVEDQDYLLIPIGEKLLIRPGGLINFSNPDTSRENDALDIAFMRLDEYTVSELKPYYNFLEKRHLLINHQNNKLFYTFMGYPSTYSRFSSTTESFHSNAFFHFNRPAMAEVYKQLNKNPQTNIIVNYDRKRVINTKKRDITQGPDLYGMSGCGLWYSDSNEIFHIESEPKLVAILTDWPIKNRNVVVGTKIEVIIRAISQQFGWRI